MDGSFVETLVAKTQVPEELEDRVFIPAGWSEARRRWPNVDALTVGTLTAFREYVHANRDQLNLERVVAHVESPTVVKLLGPLEGEEKDFRRKVHLTADWGLLASPSSLLGGGFVDVERFIIGLQSGFLPSNMRDTILGLAGSLREEVARDTTDDGFAQEVTAREGVVSVAKVKVPNPVALRPFRTFVEVEQPESLFVVRFRGGGDGAKPNVALFDADGGAWMLEAVTSIRDYLKRELPEKVAVV